VQFSNKTSKYFIKIHAKSKKVVFFNGFWPRIATHHFQAKGKKKLLENYI